MPSALHQGDEPFFVRLFVFPAIDYRVVSAFSELERLLIQTSSNKFVSAYEKAERTPSPLQKEMFLRPLKESIVHSFWANIWIKQLPTAPEPPITKTSQPFLKFFSLLADSIAVSAA
ncbi:hypothetical protein MHBO_000421 [Bonamia ostreae]|uniref:Uncharacterized protein n=1 Tax=Bonamia ostreae TaxID=126728 RepID=A0ABV2AFI1_9EUKA